MRTTLTIDEDVAARIDRLLKSRRTTLKKLVNEALRLGLDRIEDPGNRARRYRTKPLEGKPRVTDVDDIGAILSAYEGEGWR